jgi:hypothetical protein
MDSVTVPKRTGTAVHVTDTRVISAHIYRLIDDAQFPLDLFSLSSNARGQCAPRPIIGSADRAKTASLWTLRHGRKS